MALDIQVLVLFVSYFFSIFGRVMGGPTLMVIPAIL
jgi:hypothetical protein